MSLEQNPKIKKKTVLIAIIGIFVLLIIGWNIYSKKKAQQKAPPAEPSQKEMVVQKQTEELNVLRQSAGYKEPTPEQIKKQMEELDKLKGQ